MINPDIVYVAALGHLFGPNEEAKVYKTIDGGENWEKILYVSDKAGIGDLIIDPNNSRIIYATTWEMKRNGYRMDSGGPDSGLWKSTDGGDTWKDITKNKGLPEGLVGIIGIAVSPLNSDRVWALIENRDGGLFRSDDGGKTWTKTSSDNNLRQRAWYYTRIYADTENEDVLYVLNVQFWRSKDGGKTFNSIRTPHGDHHDLWIDPMDSQHLLIADDGGGQVSFDAGATWSTYHNQPTSQFYRVDVDNQFPYRVYAGQQDNSTVSIASRTMGGGITARDYYPVGGGESAHVAPHPENPNIVYAQNSLINEQAKQDDAIDINVWPDDPMGHGAEDFKYRFQWNFPIMFSPNHKNKLYAASNHLHMTTNEGQSWEIISPDLTRNDPTTLKSSGGPITKDNTGVEYYATIFALNESKQEDGLIWTGSDDGLVHITKDDGKNWTNVTPKKMPEWMMINCIEIDPFTKGGAYVVGTKYKSGDYLPYIYKTENYGKTWRQITNGIGAEDFTRALRADPKRKGLLYAGTERGMYISFDDGSNWNKFQLNLPIVPITDLAIKNDNLIAATQGRSFWMIDDLTPMHQLTSSLVQEDVILFKPQDSYRMGGGNGRTSKTEGTNHPGGVAINYFIKEKDAKEPVSLQIYDSNDVLIKTFSTDPNKEKKEVELSLENGNNIFYWDMMYPGAEKVKGMILWWASLNGPMALPGNYKVTLTMGETSRSQNFTILKNPISETTLADATAQFDFINGY